MWPILEAKFESAHQISSKLDDSRLRYSDKTIFQNGGRPPAWIFKIWYFGHVTCVWTWFYFFAQNFCVNRTINRVDIAKSRFSIWRPSAIEFAIFWYFVTWPSLEPKSAEAHQISLKSDDSQYSDKTIFKMAAVRHLEFSKSGILVMWPVSERDSTSSRKILR